ncbi:MAG: hypothetical protein WDZ86_05760 [Gammaproteobacteria bacterium]
MDNDNQAIVKRREGRFILVIMALLFSAPFLGSWIILNYTDIIDRMSVRHGDLYQPLRQIADVPVYDPRLGDAAEQSLHGKWILLYIAPGPCDEACYESLYRMRQIRLAAGRYTHNLERVWMTDAGNQADLAELLADYDGTLVLDMSQNAAAIQPEDFRYDDAANVLEDDSLYLIDPLGNLVLRYRVDAEPLKIIKDLNKLLKASRIG